MGCKLCKYKANYDTVSEKHEPASNRSSTRGSVRSVKQYSWDKREKLNPEDYTIQNIKNGTVVKNPEQINGQPLIIQNCENSRICIFDHINTVTIDDCTNCSIIIGPTKGSVFLRNSRECQCVIACQQFRTRDCKGLNIFLSCTTQPIIEASSSIKFSCYQLNYKQLEDQFQAAELSAFNNNWSNVHDFTPIQGESNWSLLSQAENLDELFPRLKEDNTTLELTTKLSESLVPYTFGASSRENNESSFIVFFNDGQSEKRAMSYINHMKDYPKLKLICSKKVQLSSVDSYRILLTDSYSSVVETGDVIGLEFNGNGCISGCQEAAIHFAKSNASTGLIYASSDPKTAKKQIENFFSFADMKMSV